MSKEKKSDKDKFKNIAKELGWDESADALDKIVEGLSLETEKKKEEEPKTKK